MDAFIVVVAPVALWPLVKYLVFVGCSVDTFGTGGPPPTPFGGIIEGVSDMVVSGSYFSPGDPVDSIGFCPALYRRFDQTWSVKPVDAVFGPPDNQFHGVTISVGAGTKEDQDLRPDHAHFRANDPAPDQIALFRRTTGDFLLYTVDPTQRPVRAILQRQQTILVGTNPPSIQTQGDIYPVSGPYFNAGQVVLALFEPLTHRWRFVTTNGSNPLPTPQNSFEFGDDFPVPGNFFGHTWQPATYNASDAVLKFMTNSTVPTTSFTRRLSGNCPDQFGTEQVFTKHGSEVAVPALIYNGNFNERLFAVFQPSTALWFFFNPFDSSGFDAPLAPRRAQRADMSSDKARPAPGPYFANGALPVLFIPGSGWVKGGTV